MKFYCIAAGPDHLYNQILPPSQNEEVPCFHGTNIKAFYTGLVEKKERTALRQG